MLADNQKMQKYVQAQQCSLTPEVENRLCHVHCVAHSLNLALADFVEIYAIRAIFQQLDA